MLAVEQPSLGAHFMPDVLDKNIKVAEFLAKKGITIAIRRVSNFGYDAVNHVSINKWAVIVDNSGVISEFVTIRATDSTTNLVTDKPLICHIMHELTTSYREQLLDFTGYCATLGIKNNTKSLMVYRKAVETGNKLRHVLGDNTLYDLLLLLENLGFE